MKQQVLIIVGPTASGKSDLAVQLAKRFNGEVISADSRQVYRGLDIGSGKITKKEMSGVPHHLLDVASPRRTFTAAQFVRLANRAIKDIASRGKLPIICGGTGFYIDALIYEQPFPNVPPNKTLRKTLEQKTATELFEILTELDPDRADTIDAHNKVRLVRAIEIATALGNVPKAPPKEARFDTCIIGTTWPDNVLQDRIHKRLHARMKRGMLAEAKRLHAAGVSWKRMHDLGLEYRYLALHLTGKLSRDAMLTELETKIWQYAKRQKKWFAQNANTMWITPPATKTVEQHVANWLQQ
ncbi:MAG: tRNA delta(2)-isopentenylpyrophosphate transferase, tRNA dimethylallyltransferase [Candidatus Parcubacteria bacterium]|jgi:tRNA dimethylallyltransferase